MLSTILKYSFNIFLIFVRSRPDVTDPAPAKYPGSGSETLIAKCITAICSYLL